MSYLGAVCRPHAAVTYMVRGGRGRDCFRCWFPVVRASFRAAGLSPRPLLRSPWFRFERRQMMVQAYNWGEQKTPYDTLELARNADEEQIKVAYRRLAKYYHPDVYDGRGTLEEGETAEVRFIKIQAAYELLMDQDKRRQYDMDHRVNPMKASQAWMEWLIKKRKAFDQRGEMAVSAWAEQQQREMQLRARRLARSKIDPEEERKIMEKQKKASADYFNSTLKRHTLVLKKRDLMRKKEDKQKLISQLLAAEGLELDSEEDEVSKSKD